MKPIEVKNVFKFEEDEDGNDYVETEQSVISRIRYQFGFHTTRLFHLKEVSLHSKHLESSTAITTRSTSQ